MMEFLFGITQGILVAFVSLMAKSNRTVRLSRLVYILIR